jgi:regulatory protein
VSAGAGSADEGREREAAIERAVRALARRDHSAAGLRAKLDRAGISEAVQADAVEALERIGYVDDGRFARDRALRLAERGYGDGWIRADLNAQGVAAEVAEAALEALEPEEARAAREVSKAGGGVRGAARLGRRGFAEETIERLLTRDVARDGAEGVG